MEEKDLLVIGAGISGLVAAKRLAESGFRVGVIEARERTGGRILSLHRDGLTMEAGPEFIHGHLQETMALLKHYRIACVPTQGKAYYGEGGRFSPSQGIDAHWGLLLEKMKEINGDMPLSDFLVAYFGADEYRGLRESALRFAAGFDLADPRTASTRSLAEEWTQEESDQYRIPTGYGTLTEALTAELHDLGVDILLNEPVTEIRWEKNKTSAITTKGIHQAQKLLLTLPAGVVMHQESGDYTFRFSPEVAEKRKALSMLGFGTVIKVLLYWKTAFWKKDLPDLQFIFSKGDIPTWWTQNPLDSNMLVGWLGGPPADARAGWPDAEILDLALGNLSALFSLPKAQLSAALADYKIFNWRKDPYTRGAYSFDLADAGQARGIWKEALEETIYFSGEACYQGPHIGTVEAAIVSGLESAGEICRSTGKIKAVPG